MILPKNINIITATVVASHLARHGVDAHGYLKSPRSRNFIATQEEEGLWSGGTDHDPAAENCPHCLNIGGTEARCGKVGDHNYDYPPNAIGTGVLPPTTQGCYEEESIIDIESVLTAHHKGHFEVKACIISPGEVATQACFDSNPLEFISDELYGARPHSAYPGRAYIPLKKHPDLMNQMMQLGNGNYPFHHKFKLPAGLRGDLVLLQWYYLTANSCKPEGYDSYDWPADFYPGDDVSTCGQIPPDGRGVPEQFWNCAEVEISVADGCGASPSAGPLPNYLPTSLPTPFPSKGPTFANATSTPTAEPTRIPTSAPIIQNNNTRDELVLNRISRCGYTELDAREQCKPVCATDVDCLTDEFCWHPHENYCGSIPQRMYENPVKSPVISRCGVSEELARTFCGEPCSWQCSKPGESCIAVISNYCDSAYTELGTNVFA